MQSRSHHILAVACTAVACTVVALSGCGGDSGEDDPGEPAVTGPLPRSGSVLFVLRGPASVSGDRIELQTDEVEWFTDRPERLAGVADADELVKDWKDYGFTTEPPNAALAGEETDAEVELTNPEITTEGLSFEFESLRGDVVEGDDASVSVFIDSSEWETDMHVYARIDSNTTAGTSGWCDTGDQTALVNPQINSSPANWSYYPTESITLTGDDQEIFTAASKGGTTSFSVTYNVLCETGGDATPVGEVNFAGTVPDSPIKDSFDCNAKHIQSTNPSENFLCIPSDVSGYHVDAKARILYSSAGPGVNDQITD